MAKELSIRIPTPQLQIDFSFLLSQVRKLMLQEALGDAVTAISLSQIDRELASYAPAEALSALARKGLRGELLFAVPCLLESNPRLLGYYRLLLGFSQKAFYSSNFGVGRFKSMEEKGTLSQDNRGHLETLCRAMNQCSNNLLTGLGAERVSKELLDDLTLLTLGPQMRGGTNVKLGAAGIVVVFEAIHRIVVSHAIAADPHRIEVGNAAGRKVLIEFAPDPDIMIREEISPGIYRNIIAIEVKAGTDFSNIHNRIGEAEKSHQKARLAGFVECWTVVNVNKLNTAMAHRESPSTNRFYLMEKIKVGSGEEFEDFKNRVISLTGIPG